MKKIDDDFLNLFFWILILYISLLALAVKNLVLVILLILSLIVILILFYKAIELGAGNIKLESYLKERIKYLKTEKHNMEYLKTPLLTEEDYQQMLNKELTLLEEFEENLKQENIEELKDLELKKASLNARIEQEKQKYKEYKEKDAN